MMRKKIILACMAVMAACLLWLVRDRWYLPPVQEAEHEGLRVGLSQTEALTPWKTAQIKSFKEAARRRGAQLVYNVPEEESLEWQLEDIYSLMDSDIDYLILVPAARTGYDQALAAARERGIPVILAEQDVELDPEYHREDYILGYVASDYFAEGELCADILSGHFGIEPCHIMVIQGEKSSAMEWERYMGFMHGVREHSNLYISKRVENSGDRLAAQKVTESVIADQDIDFNAVFAQSDEDGLGALQAFKLAEITPGEDVSIVSIGGIQDVFKAIIAQEYLATVKSSPEYGDIVFDIINRDQRGERMDEQTVLKHQIYTIDNAEESFDDAY